MLKLHRRTILPSVGCRVPNLSFLGQLAAYFEAKITILVMLDDHGSRFLLQLCFDHFQNHFAKRGLPAPPCAGFKQSSVTL